MEIIDITLLLDSKTLVYEGDPPFQAKRLMEISPDDPGTMNLSSIELGSHAGTHVDAPLHFVSEAPGIEALDLEILCGPARVIDLRGCGWQLDASLFRQIDLEGVRRLLLKTDNCRLLGEPSFSRTYAYLTGDGASYLRHEVGLSLLGIDYLSVDPWPEEWPGFEFPAHHALLDPSPGEAPVVIVESLDLRNVEAGDYELLCLPMKIRGVEGAPVRAVLRRLLV